VALEELLASADLVSIHCPLAESTRGLVGERELRMMRPEAILVNTSRGAVVDEPALTQALREGWIAGAALDVMLKEPPDADNPLLQLDNVIVSPPWLPDPTCSRASCGGQCARAWPTSRRTAGPRQSSTVAPNCAGH